MADIPPPPPPGNLPPPGGYQPPGGFQPPGGYQPPGGFGGVPGPYGGMPHPPNVPNYLVQAILVTLFCCLPVGIASIVFAAQVNGKLAAGDHQGALDSSRKARTWAWVALWAGAAWAVIWGILLLAAGSGSG